jgi:hypothetical protein
MTKLSLIALGTSLAVAGFQSAAGAQLHTTLRTTVESAHVQELSLDDGRHAWIGADHRLYLRDANGHSAPAPRGHYMSNHGCFKIADDALIDEATFERVRSRLQ